MHRAQRDRTLVILLLVSILLPLGCVAGNPIGPIRATMTPPDLQYLPEEKLRTTMWVLAAEIQHLERLMTQPTGEEREAMQPIVASTLDRMRIAARTLDQSGRSSQHPILNQNLSKFLGRLERAKRAVDRDPPNYFPASTIAGSCFLCHGGQSGTAKWEPDERRKSL